MRPPSEPRADLAGSHALLIGTSRFHERAYTGVPAAANSLTGMYEMLTEPSCGGWPPDQVTVIADPEGAAQLIQRIRRLAETTTGTLLLYYVGHGVISERGNLTLTLTDTTATDPDLTGVEYDHIDRALRASPARVSIVILDCCYSGRAISALSGPDTVADSTSVEGVYTLTAAEGPAHVVPHHQQHTTGTSFTQELLGLITEGLPDGPEMLSFDLLYGHLAQRLRRRGLPRPNQRGTDTVHHFAVARNRAYGGSSRPQNEGEERAPTASSDAGSRHEPPRSERPTTVAPYRAVPRTALRLPTPSATATGNDTLAFQSRIRAGKVLTSYLGFPHVAFVVVICLFAIVVSIGSPRVVSLIAAGILLGIAVALLLIILMHFVMIVVDLVGPRRLTIGPEGVAIVWGRRRAIYAWEEIAALEVARTGRLRPRPTLMLWTSPSPRRVPAPEVPRLSRNPRRPPWRDRGTGWIRICYLDQLQRGRELERLLTKDA
ncbi:caspase domain-containing protein [Actinomadura pelletieri DSM 43383]|uniref:Caspase domain-containing protein n=1 Tax=Actinomadura pelletieri DSM 43383 TaxID=1120940 RepID=A0A495QUL7_9ACTN|nr:caspase family protein [Actinomadura pelletieri]RKS77121.1 caspase domain-containing protein [Actinomadura pelletieri DSM 43383]